MQKDKKRLIIETAISLFIEKGFHQTSIRDIAHRAGISLGNLYNHFSGKAELIASIAFLEGEEQQSLELVLADLSNPIDTFERFLIAYINIHATPEDAAISAEILAEAIRNPNISIGFNENQKKLAGKLVKLLDKGKNDKCMEFDGDVELVALGIIDILESSCIKSAFYKGRERERYLAQIKKVCTLIIGEFKL